MLNFAVVMLGFLLMVDETTSHSVSGPHIADVNILLPPKMTHPVEYRLQGSDGCFKWSWDHHDILSVLPEYNSSSRCSTSARLRSIAPYSGRKETAVYAADIHSGIVIRCKVFIDKFSRIQIFHNSIKLDLDGLATLRVRAFDGEENVFSSLVGLQFMWQLMPETAGLPHHLVHLPLKDSPLSDCGGLCGDLDIQIKLEDSGVFSDLFVVRGIEIGHESVTVHSLEPQLNDMADKIVLTVAEAMSLYPPSPVYVLIGAAVTYNLKIIRGNIPQVVPLPSPYYQWSVTNSSVAQVDPLMGLANALRLGLTTVIVEDKRVSGHIQMSSLNVVLPDSLFLYIRPLFTTNDPSEGAEAISSMARWYVISGHQYVIQIKVFSRGPGVQEIYLTESDDVKLYDNQSSYWRIDFAPDDVAPGRGWQFCRILEATSQGQGKLSASLTYFSGHHESKEVLKFVQEVIVCDQVKFSLDKRSGTSQSILLPWAPSVYQEVELKATGGCAKTSSEYKWLSSDMSIISISALGIVQAKRPGKATIKVRSIFDSSNYDEVVVEVSIPSSMEMLQIFPVETVVGSQLQAAVTMKTSNGAHFYSCDAFKDFIDWRIGNESFIIVNVTRESPALDMLGKIEHQGSFHAPLCSWTYVHASDSGQALLQATLSKEYHQFDHSLHGPIVLKASSRVAAYLPLLVQQAGDGSQFGGYWFNLAQLEADNHVENLDKVYLVPGTRLDVMLRGGPKWWDKSIDFVETVEILDKKHAPVEDGILVHRVSGSYRSRYRVLCQTHGTFELLFRRGNLVGPDHPLPAVAEVALSVLCSIPSSIAVIADEPVNKHDVIRIAIQADRSPDRTRVTPVTVANGRTIRIAAVGISNLGEPFANSSSLSLRWELCSCAGLAHWKDAHDSGRPTYGWERFLSLQNESGLCIVRASVISFIDVLGGNYSTELLQTSKNVLTDAIRLQLVYTLRVHPEFNLLVWNPNAKVKISIDGGSCSFEAVANDSRVVEVIQPAPVLQCSELVLYPKGVGTTLVTVVDVGLAPPLAASALVQVADVDWMKITSPEEISVMEGSSQIINITAGISDGSTFDSNQFLYMTIHVHIEDHTVELVADGNCSIPYACIKKPSFEIKATELGITSLFVSALQQSGHQIYSQTIKIEVYAPPKIEPRDIYLLPGASYMLMVKGGPTVGIYVEYESEDNAIATIHETSGRLSAVSPGNTTIHATFFSTGASVICRAYCTVKVEIPSTVILNVQNGQLGLGHEMPIYPLFPEGNLFSFYELCKSYKWTVEDEKVLSFQMLDPLIGEIYRSPLTAGKEVQYNSYINEKQLGFINVLYGRSAGRTNVGVSFSCEFRFRSGGSDMQTRSYNTSASVLVMPDLPLALGAPITWLLPPYYTTSSILPSSVESYGQLDSQSRRGTIIYSLLRNCGQKNVLQKDAIYIDGDKIKTTETNDLTCIQAKDRSTGRVEIATCVRVSEVAQIRITNQEFRFHALNLAVGAELTLPISYCDSLGSLFYEAHNVVPVYVETNNPDVVALNYSQEGNGNVYVKARQHGRALLRVSIKNSPEKSDYMLISVGALIHPQNPLLHVGSHLNFSIKGSNHQSSGNWVTGNTSVVSVDLVSGLAEAVGEGTTQVIFDGSSLKSQTTVTVLKGDFVSVEAPVEMLTNVPFPTKGYNFSVKFSNEFGAPGIDKGVAYDCRVDPLFVGYAKPWLDLPNNNSYCLFFPYSPEHLARSMPKSKDMRPDITISIYASMREANHASGSASALFVGGFAILEMSKSLLVLNLTPVSNKTIITILGNTDVEIHWRERDLIVFGPVHREDFGIGGRAQYEVNAVGNKRFEDKILITLPANGQRVEIDVSYEPGETTAAEPSFHTSFWFAIVACLSLLIFTLGIFIFLLDRPNRSQPSTMPAPPNTAAATMTPDRSPPVISTDHSPRTPQPFVDYVRRTIDETPYYRRDGRRRVNPQNTF